jgi:RimJ/RimL family protein N-acetyltransferase
MQPFCESIDDDVCYWQGYEPPNIAQYRSLLQLVIRWPDRVPPVRPLALTCEGQFAGAYFLTPSIWWRDRWNVALGWWLAPEPRGRGLGRSSLSVVLAHVHRDLGLRVARMGTGVDNVRAVRQIEANGAVAVDEGPHTLPNGRVVTARWYHHEQSY